MESERQEEILTFIGKHPFSLWIVMWLQLFNVFALLMQSILMEQEWLPEWVGMMPAFNTNAGIILLTLSLLGLITIAGLWFRQKWAWQLTTIQVGATLFTLIYLYFNNIPQYISMATNIGIVFYLNQVNIRYDLFQKSKHSHQGT